MTIPCPPPSPPQWKLITHLVPIFRVTFWSHKFVLESSLPSLLVLVTSLSLAAGMQSEIQVSSRVLECPKFAAYCSRVEQNQTSNSASTMSLTLTQFRYSGLLIVVINTKRVLMKTPESDSQANTNGTRWANITFRHLSVSGYQMAEQKKGG